MTTNHKQALAELLRLHKDNPAHIALIICGSVATGQTHEHSDIDLYLVVTDTEYANIRTKKDFFYGSWDPHAFSGIEIDGKIIKMDFLQSAVTQASEPTRASFQDAYPLFSHNNAIAGLIKQIAVYPDWELDKKLKGFHAYLYRNESGRPNVNCK